MNNYQYDYIGITSMLMAVSEFFIGFEFLIDGFEFSPSITEKLIIIAMLLVGIIVNSLIAAVAFHYSTRDERLREKIKPSKERAFMVMYLIFNLPSVGLYLIYRFLKEFINFFKVLMQYVYSYLEGDNH